MHHLLPVSRSQHRRPFSARSARFLIALAAMVAPAMIAPTTAAAQCAVCGNPAFAAGDNDIARAFGDGSPKELRLSGGLVYSYLGMSDIYTGTTKLSGTDKSAWVYTRDWGLRIHMLTVMAGVELSSGTTLHVIVPMGRADSTQAVDSSPTHDADNVPIGNSSDYGISDVEVRVRQRLTRLLGLTGTWVPQIVVTAGFVVPSGTFLVADSADANTDQYVSLGRGAWWALAGVDFYGRVTDSIGWSLNNTVRYPLTPSTDTGYYFHWGPETDSNLSANFVIVKGVLNAALAASFQWRDAGTERLAPGDPIETFANGGGTWLGINPTIQAVIGGGVSATATLRVPVYRDVRGYQPVPGLGGVFALNWSWDTAPKSTAPEPALEPGDKPKEPAIAQVLVPGKTTLVEYGASWCAVCKRLKPKLAAFAATREDVAFRHLDVTNWQVDRMKRVLPAQPGLPVLDVFGPDGRLIKRLWGEKTFGFAAVVPAPPSQQPHH